MKQKWEPVDADNLVRNADSGIYYLRAKIAGKVVRKTLKTTKLRIAKLKRDDMLLRLRTARPDDAASTLSSLITRARAYYAALPSYQLKPRSMDYRNYMFEIIERTAPVDPVEWTAAKLRAWWSDDEITRYSNGVRNNLLGTLRRMIALMIEAGEIAADPSLSLTRVSIKHEEVIVPSKAEFAAVVAEMRSQPRALESANMVEFMAYSGVRIGELREIRWRDIGEDEIIVSGGEAGTKNHRTRRVPITGAMRDLLGRMTADKPAHLLFHTLSPKRALTRACKTVKCHAMTPHTCRHYFATACIESGVDIPTVARWLGHLDGGVLAMQVYGHLRNAHSMAQAASVRL